MVEGLPANAGDMGSSPGPGRSYVPWSSWAPAPQLLSLRSGAHVPQLLRRARLEPVLHNGGGQCSGKTAHCNEEWPLPAATRESPCAAAKAQCSQK